MRSHSKPRQRGAKWIGRLTAIAALLGVVLAGCGKSTTRVVAVSSGAASKPVPTEVIVSAAQSVVAVECPSGSVISGGSGFKELRSGSIVTAAHVAQACSVGGSIQVGTESGNVYQFDPTRDLAFVGSRTSNVPPQLALATRPAYVGERIEILGFPGPSGDFSASPGRVTAIDQKITTSEPGYRETLTDAIKVSGAAYPGDSGGPAIDAQGKVVGVVEFANAARTTAYLTPAADVAAEPTSG